MIPCGISLSPRGDLRANGEREVLGNKGGIAYREYDVPSGSNQVRGSVLVNRKGLLQELRFS